MSIPVAPSVDAQTMRVLDHGYVKFIECWGSDIRIVEAARMSTDKGFLGWGPKHAGECMHWDDQSAGICDCTPQPGDEKLLKFLWENKHHTPFEMGGMTIEVQAPIMVFREWHRHRTQSYNELSARYTALPDLYYVPSFERLEAGRQSVKNKQGSDDKQLMAVEEVETATAIFHESYTNSRRDYEELLNMGFARELARLVIPVAQYSRMRASANLRNWLAFLTLRTADTAQWEIRQYAKLLNAMVSQAFPRIWEVVNGDK